MCDDCHVSRSVGPPSSPCPTGTKFEVTPGLTSVSILDYTLTKHVNFEADIHLPEDEGVVQVETFGVSMNADGTVFYGMQVRTAT